MAVATRRLAQRIAALENALGMHEEELKAAWRVSLGEWFDRQFPRPEFQKAKACVIEALCSDQPSTTLKATIITEGKPMLYSWLINWYNRDTSPLYAKRYSRAYTRPSQLTGANSRIVVRALPANFLERPPLVRSYGNVDLDTV
jgi:hypothetical protein